VTRAGCAWPAINLHHLKVGNFVVQKRPLRICTFWWIPVARQTETTDAKIVKVNVDHSPELAARYDINSIPSLKVFEKGEVVDGHVGLAGKGRLKKMLGI
jgi:hypothetical protein